MIEAKHGKSISAYINYPEEQEIILGMGTCVRVKSDPLEHPALNVVQLVEIDNGSGRQLASSSATLSAYPYDHRNATREYRSPYRSFHTMIHLRP